ncbi:hypothetical protein Tco_0291177 [Tanacetum coccineum]
MVGTRNIVVERVVEDRIKNWVSDQMESAMERLRVELTTISSNALSGAGSRSMETVRHNGEGTSQGGQPPQFTRMTKIEFPNFGGEDNLRHVDTIEVFQNAFDKLISRVDSTEDQQRSFYIARLQNDVDLAEVVTWSWESSTLGNIQFNFQQLRMEFKFRGRKVALRGTKKPTLNMVSAIIEGIPIPTPISNVLSYFNDVFGVPTVDAGPSIEERAILFLEAHDRVKKGPLFKRP